MADLSGTNLTFNSLLKAYSKVQAQLVSMVKNLAKSSSAANPGEFLLVQFRMSQVTQMGESISNLISQVNSLINAAVRNQRPQ